MFKSIAIAVLVGLGGFLAFAATRPDSFRVERTTVIKAPPERVYALIQDFRRWTEWSPYETLDADLKRIYGGPLSGEGATYAWEGREAGSGQMRIIGAEPASRVLIRLEFTKPMQAVNTADFTLAPVAEGTRVTWAMYGPMTFVSKLMSVFFSMDRLVGKDFEAGLAKLKAQAEA
ncbi:MAG: SRPBCC family protein [Phenylobacterium sp.]|uniref:SRPBCC family protein n=1 Tax=Phenylobacterium sp. TaxID=1871053 RepID=UPI00391CDD1A